MLAFAGSFAREQSRGDVLGGRESSHLVGHDHPNQPRPIALPRLDIGKRRHSLDQRIVDALVTIGTLLPEAADGYVNEGRIDGTQGGFADAHPLGDPRPAVLNENIRPGHKLMKGRKAGVILQIDHNRALAPVGGGKSGRKARNAPHMPQNVPFGRLDLDHIGALIRKNSGCQWARNHLGHINDSKSFQSARHCNPPFNRRRQRDEPTDSTPAGFELPECNELLCRTGHACFGYWMDCARASSWDPIARIRPELRMPTTSAATRPAARGRKPRPFSRES